MFLGEISVGNVIGSNLSGQLDIIGGDVSVVLGLSDTPVEGN